MTPDQAIEIIKLLHSIQTGLMVTVVIISFVAGMLIFRLISD